MLNSKSQSSTDIEIQVEEIISKIKSKTISHKSESDIYSLNHFEIQESQTTQNEEAGKCINKKGFISCVTSVGGPFFSNSYMAEFFRGLSLIFRCMRDIFEPKSDYPTIIHTDKRTIILAVFHENLFILVGEPSPTDSFQYSLNNKIIDCFCQSFISILFQDTLKIAANCYNSLRFTKSFEFLFNQLFESMNNDILYIFKAFPIHSMTFDGRKIINIFVKKTVPANAYLTIFTNKNKLVSIFLHPAFKKISFQDLSLVYSIINDLHINIPSASYFIPLILPSIDTNATFQLFINKQNSQDGFNIGLIHAPKNGIPNSDLISFVDNFYEMISSDLIIKNSVNLCLKSPYIKGKPKIENVFNFIVVFHDQIVPQYFTCMDSKEFSTYKQIYLEMFLKSQHCNSFYMFTPTYISIYLTSHTSSYSLYFLAKPNLNEIQIENLCQEIKTTVHNYFKPIMQTSYLIN